MRISLKINYSLKTYFWPLNGNIDHTLGLNIEVHHSRFPKSKFVTTDEIILFQTF